MKTVFNTEYASHYDQLYGDKDYGAECDLIETVLRRFGDGETRAILDIGCGTGSHAIRLAERGYDVTGIDRSSEMLGQAQEKAACLPSPPSFMQGDLRTIDLNKSFDAVLMMFAVLSYQTSNNDVMAALQGVRRHLRPKGLFICDVWYGPAVLAIKPGEREKVISNDSGQLVRRAGGSLDIRHHLCEVRYGVRLLQGGELISQTEEAHMMRYFFPMELELFLNQANLELKALTAFSDLAKPADESTWNALAVARAI